MSSKDILAELAAGGEVEAHGGFSIDKEKAREKMRQFQLSDPRQYVLMLVQAAVHQGATLIEFQIDASDMEAWFDGEGYSKADLDDLFVSMFGDRPQSNLRSRQELAIGLNGALALNPRWVRVSSHHAETSSSLQLRPGGGAVESAQDCAPRDERGTRVHVKQRFRPGLALRFVDNLRGTIAEEAILKERVRYAELPVILDGGRISWGLRLGSVVGRVDVEGEGIRGFCGFLVEHDPPPATLEVLNAGVWLATHPLPSFPAGFVAMVDSIALRKDVSQSDVVRDDAYSEVLGRLGIALERSLLSMAQLFQEDPQKWEELPSALRSRMPTWIAERVKAPWRLQLVGDVLPLYLALPVWQRLGGEWMSTAQLRGKGHVDFVSRPRGEREGFSRAIRAESEALRSALRVIFDDSLRDRTSAYESAAERAEHKAKLFRRDWSTTLGDGLYLAREPVMGEGIEGEVGIRRSDREESVVQLVYRGKLLETLVLKRSVLHIPGFVAVVEANFEPTSDWTRSRRSEALARGLHAVIEATMRAFETVGRTVAVSAEPRLRPVLRTLVALVCRPSFGRSFYVAAGFSKQRAARWVNKFGECGLSDPFGDAHPLLALPLFPQLAGAPWSLSQLREIHSPQNPVKVLLAGKARSGAFEGYVLCDKASRVLLRRTLGSDAVVAAEDAYATDVAAQAWRSKPAEPFELFGETAQRVAFSAHGMDVKAGILVGAADAKDSGGDVSVRVMKERRSVEFVSLPCPIGSIVMVVDWLDAPLRSDFSGLRTKARPVLQKVVDLAAVELFLGAFATRNADGTDPQWKSTIRQLTLAPFLHPGWLQAFDASHDAHGASHATERMVTLLRLAAHEDEPLSRGAVRALFDGEVSKQHPPADAALEALVRAIGPVWAELREVAMLPAFHEHCSIASVLADLERHNKALVMDASNLPKAVAGGVPRVVLVATKAMFEVLGRVFGQDTLADGRAWFDLWQAREAFERQSKVDLALPSDEVLVKVEAQGELQGEIGIPRAHPSIPSATILACRRRRRVCDVVVPEAQASLVGVLQAESFGVGREFSSLSEKDIVHIAAACQDAWPRLAEALRDAWPELSDEEVAWARAWGRLLLGLMVGDRGRRALKEPGPAALLELRLFEHLDGTFWELDAILGLSGGDEQVYCAAGSSDATGPFPRLVFVTHAHVKELLELLCGEVKDYDERLRQRRIRDGNRNAAPAMPTGRVDAVEVEAVDGRGVKGLLWIDPMLDEGAVALGDAEKIAGYSDVSALFIVGGAVHGPAVSIDAGWEFASLDKRGGEYLQQKAREMYQRVHERFDPAAADRSFAWLQDRSTLRRLVQRMFEQWSSGRKPGDGASRRFYKALRTVPLFELLNGRSISLDQREKLNGPESEGAGPASSAPKAVSEPASTPEPEVEVKLEPIVAPPTADAVLLDAIRTELRIVRRGSPGMFSNAMLDLLRVMEHGSSMLAEFSDGVVFVNVRHPVAELARSGTPELRGRYVSIVASSVFSAFNVGLEEVTDHHELEFHRLHAQHLAT
ncbi:MAG: hypothetical protein ACRBN8_10350 [Nannocystales bacterium]